MAPILSVLTIHTKNDDNRNNNKGMNRSGGHLWSDTYVYGVDCGDGFMGVICLHTHKVA